MKKLIVLISIFNMLLTLAQEKKELIVFRTDITPKIDGILDDLAWKNANEATNFIQFQPDMGINERAHQKNEIKMTYDDDAIYISAYLQDAPNNIMKQLTSRDDFGQSDYFGVTLNPNNDSQNDTKFIVFSSGVQADAIATTGGKDDFEWNAVWKSAVTIVENGWIVEIKIPYAALRFSNEAIQTWGVNFHRYFRKTKAQYSWNPIDTTTGYEGLYHGEIKGIKNIKPPTRLSFNPFASYLVNHFNNETNNDFSLGLDVKYGINENFTIDATLIPDFSQAGFDDVQLNLGPFEQQFAEQRQFFKEGVNLFSKGDLFYSRRIGSKPVAYQNVKNSLKEDEIIISAPENIKMLNAVKLSGRTKSGLGIAFFNAFTEKTNAEIQDTISKNSRTEIIEPFANYNVVVLDQQFNRNSSVSIVNTNVTRKGNFRDANVTALLTNLRNKKNTFGIETQFKMSRLSDIGDSQNGYSSKIEIGKISGNFQYGIEHELVNRTYDINDLGINFQNNYSHFTGKFSYEIFKPTKIFNNFSINATSTYKRRHKPDTYNGNNFMVDFFAQTRKLFAFGADINIEIGKQYDYNESRENKAFIYKNLLETMFWISTNYNKTFAIDSRIRFETLFDHERDFIGYGFEISPRLRLSDKLIFTYGFDYNTKEGGRGYVSKINDDIIFGEYNQNSIENTISGKYHFNTKHGLSLSFRNYWSTATYDPSLFRLQEDGTLSPNDNYTVNDINDPNRNFNIWNLDLKYTWDFAPGSQLVALYRNQLLSNTTASKDDYLVSLKNILNEPMRQVFSMRFVYYIDYNNFKKSLQHKNS